MSLALSFPLDHVVTPTGDVTIMLSFPNAPFAVWDARNTMTRNADKKAPKFVMFSASAANLTHASPVWRRMLSGNMKKDHQEEDGTVLVHVLNFDEEAFLVFLHFVHSQPQKIERKPSVETIAKLAAIADFYQCGYLISFFVSAWRDVLDPKGKEKEYNRDLILRIWVAAFFNFEEIFTRATKIAIECAPDVIQSLDLPRLQPIVKALNTAREQKIRSAVLSLLHSPNPRDPSTPDPRCHIDFFNPPYHGLAFVHMKNSAESNETYHDPVIRRMFFSRENSGNISTEPLPSSAELWGDVDWDVEGLVLADIEH